MKPIYLLQDNARELLDEDFLGMKAWIDVIAGTAVGNDGPFTIGIYKEWGYGKTTLLRLAKQTVEEYPQRKNEPVVTVWFNAWQFEREPHPLFPLIAAITQSLGGGGHRRASGCRVRSSVEEVRGRIVAAIEPLLQT